MSRLNESGELGKNFSDSPPELNFNPVVGFSWDVNAASSLLPTLTYDELSAFTRPTSSSATTGGSDDKWLSRKREASSKSRSDELSPTKAGFSDSSSKSNVRKVHTKSRLGCLNCKKRRVKCAENHPVCTQCTRRRMTCQWPELQFLHSSVNGRAPTKPQGTSTVPKPLKTPDAEFTMQDFRFFHHFIGSCYPHQPVGCTREWTHEIPSIAHNHPYLLHAMLGLAATDLHYSSPGTESSLADLKAVGLSHRQTAINTLNKALSSSTMTSEQGNAMLATCYTLVFQSAMIEDGLADYLTFIRGCPLIQVQMGIKQLNLILFTGMPEHTFDKFGSAVPPTLNLNPAPLLGARASLDAFEHLCQLDYEKSMRGAFVRMVDGLLRNSAREAYMAMADVYMLFSWQMSHPTFQHFINPSNAVGKLLLCHLVTVSTLLGPVSAAEQAGKTRAAPAQPPTHLTIKWVHNIIASVPREMEQYYEWPRARAAFIEQDMARGDEGRGYEVDRAG